MTGFVYLRDGVYMLALYERERGGLQFREVHELKTSDAYLSGVIARLDMVYMDVPRSSVRFRILSFPFDERDKLDGVIPFQLQEMITENVEDIVYDFTVVGKDDGNYRVAVCFADRDTVRGMRDDLARFGIDPAVITSVEAHWSLPGNTLEGGGASGTPTDTDFHGRVRRVMEECRINFARGEFAYRGDVEKAKGYLKVTAVLGVLLYLSVMFHLAMDIRNSVTAEKEVRQAMEQLYRRVVPGEGRVVNPVYQLRAFRKQMKEKAVVLNDARPLGIFREIAGIWKGETVLESLKIESGYVTLRGEAPSISDVQSLADALTERIGGTPAVDTRQTSGGRTGFTIQIKKKEGNSG